MTNVARLLGAAAAASLFACASAGDPATPSGGGMEGRGASAGAAAAAGSRPASESGAGGSGGAGPGGSSAAPMAGATGGVEPCPPAPEACPTRAGLTPPCGVSHCLKADGTRTVQATTYDTCHPDRLPDMGVTHPKNPLKGQFSPTWHGSEGDDDQCKYHVELQVDDVAQGQDVSFTLDVTKLSDGAAVKDDAPEPTVEAFLSSDHALTITDVQSRMVAPGKFTVGPVRFDQCGRWTVRFHLYPHCGNDFADSPYASIAFYVDVP